MKETWKSIDEVGGRYEVSNRGNVRSWVKTSGNKREHPLVMNQHTYLGYNYISLKKHTGSKYISRRVHRLVAKAFIPNPSNKPYINHKNGIKNDNRVENLEWVTASENDIHAFENGLREPMKGEKNGNATLSDKDVLEIRRLYFEGGVSQYTIAESYGIVQNHVSDIVNFKRWSHIGQKYKGLEKPVNYLMGEDVYGAKLNAKKVKEMREIRKRDGLTYGEIAKMFGVSRHSASRAINGETWGAV